MRGAAVLLVFLLTITTVSAATTIYNGTLGPGINATTTSGLTFSVFGSPDPERAMVYFYGGQSFYLYNGTCDEKNSMRICLWNVGHSGYDWKTPDPDRHTTYTVLYQYSVSIRTSTSALSFSRSIPNPTLPPDGEAKVETTLKNTGELPALNVSFMELVPDGLKVTQITDCTLSGSTVKWQGVLNPNQEADCSYKVTGKVPGTYRIQANASWTDDAYAKTASFASSDVVVSSHPITLSVTFTNTTLGVGDQFNITLSLNPTQIIYIDALRLNLPQGITVVEAPDGFEAPEYTYEGTVNKPTSMSFLAKATRTGEQKATASLDYRLSSVSSSVESSASLTASIERGFIQTRIKEGVLDLEGGELVFQFINPTANTFYNITPRLVTTIPLDFEDETFPKLSKLTNHEFEYALSTVPVNHSTQSLKISVDYYTEYGEKLTEEIEQEVTVLTSEEAPVPEPAPAPEPEAEPEVEPEWIKKELLLLVIPCVLIAIFMCIILFTYKFKKV